MSLSELESLLLRLCSDTYHYAAPSGLARYVVYGVTGAETLFGGDAIALQLPIVQIDVYTQDEADTLPLDIAEALSAFGQPVSVAGPEYLDNQLSQVTTLTLTLV